MSRNWHDEVFFGIHYDLHAGAGDTVLGAELTAEHLYERLARVRPDWIQCDCKGHPGYTSWPTEVGTTSPGVVRDAVRIHREVTTKLGIPLGMHYSGVWDTRAIELHPEWARVLADGSRDPNNTCRLSAYDSELMIPQMIELIDKYDVDGFWVDGENWASRPCYCDRCRAEFTRRCGIAEVPDEKGQPHWDEWLAFHRDLFVEHVTAYADAVHARKPECLICSNWMYTVRQPDPIRAPVDYLSGDYDWAWGADRAAVEGRVLDGRGKTWDLMAWGFTKAGAMQNDPPWVMKTATHLCQELAEVIALGGAVMVYAKPQRTGWLTGWHQDLLAEVAGWCRARKAVCFRSETVPQALILHLADHYYAHNDPLFNYGPAVQPVEGALHALLETHHSADILIAETALERMDQYRLVVMPEQTRRTDDDGRSDALAGKLEAFAAAGGYVLMSGAHLSRDFPQLVGAVPDTDAATSGGSWGTLNLPVDGISTGVCGEWQVVKPNAETEIWTCAMTEQEPEKDGTELPVVTCRRVGKGAIVAVHGPLFANYFMSHYPPVRRFIRLLIDRLPVEWLVTVDAPPRLEMVLRRQDGKLCINLINRGAGEMLSPRRMIVEELPPVEDIVLNIRQQEPPASVTLEPGGTVLDWRHADGRIEVHVPRVDIHAVIVVE